MERCHVQYIEICPDKVAGVRCCPEDFMNPQALFSLFKSTIPDSGRIRYPFHIGTGLITDKWYEKYRPVSGFVLMSPYQYYSPRQLLSQRLKCVLNELMYEAVIVVNRDSFPDFLNDTDLSLHHPLNQTSVLPELVVANFIFLHEWGHIVKAATHGFNPTTAASLCTRKRRIINQAKANEEDQWCDSFALKQLQQMINSGTQFPIQRIP